MKNVIIGAGNLGIDIGLAIRGQEYGDVSFLSKSAGMEFTPQTRFMFNKNADNVFYCLGGGSVLEAERDPAMSKAFNCDTPVHLASALNYPHIKLVVFSTDYVADEKLPSDFTSECEAPLSLYAKHKLQMEEDLLKLNRGNVAIIRVGSLYGTHKPEKTFPGKILRNFGAGDLKFKIKLPMNLVTPTPTSWLAHMILKNWRRLFNEKCTLVHHCAPLGNIAVHEWAKLVLDGLRRPEDFDDSMPYVYDDQRPKVSFLKCNFARDNYYWKDLWDCHFRRDWFYPTDKRIESFPPPSTIFR